MVLPRFIIVQSIENGLYLRKVPEDVCKHNGLPENFVSFSEVDIASPLVKFEVEISKSFSWAVHIRCCSNNQYLRKLDEHAVSSWIVAAAEKRHVSTRVTYVKASDAENQYRFVLDNTLLLTWVSPWKDGLYAGNYGKDGHNNQFIVLNWDQLFPKIPKCVAFMRNSDKKYLRVEMSHGTDRDKYYLKFTETVLDDENVQHEIIPLVDDNKHHHNNIVRIKCKANGMFWKCTDPDNWVLASGGPDTENDPNTLFQTIKLNDSGLALNNIKNQMFCKSHFLDDNKECLIASSSDLIDDAKFQLVHISSSSPSSSSSSSSEHSAS